MSKRNENGFPNQDGTDSSGESDLGSYTPPPENKNTDNPQPGDKPPEDDTNAILTIEEHRQNLGIDVPVFLAVMELQGWATGKKIPKTDFLKAVESFLKSSIGG